MAYNEPYDDFGYFRDNPSLMQGAAETPGTPAESYDIAALVRAMIDARGATQGLSASDYQMLVKELETLYQRQREAGQSHEAALAHVQGTLPATYQDTPQPGAQPDQGAGGGSSSGGSGSGGGTYGIDPSYLEPWTEVFQAPAGSKLPTWKPPAAFTYEDFKPVSAQDLLKDPGYLFREQRITDSIQNSAAAKGLLGSSGTIYDLANSVGNFASQEYGSANDRVWNQWLGGYNNKLSTYNTNYGATKDAYGYDRDRAKEIYDRAWREYNDRRNTFYTNQDRPINTIIRVAELGGRAAAL